MQKLISTLSTLFFLALAFNGCKKDAVEKEETFFNAGCEINSFQLSPGLDYTLDYHTPNILRGYSARISQELAFEAQFDGSSLIKLNVGNLPFLKTGSLQFDYGVYGLIRVTFFTTSFYNITNNIDSLDEISKVEFKYNQLNKPVSMTYYSLENSGIAPQRIYKVVYSRNFDFDQFGNLVKEITFRPNMNGEMKLAQTSTHRYDNNINSCRQLNYLFFDPELSAPYIFAENNKISTQTSYDGQNSNGKDFKVLYDDKNYVTDDGVRFSKIIWNCK